MKQAKPDLVGSYKQDALSTMVKREPGCPKLKLLPRKRPVMPRQASSTRKSVMLKAAAILQRGMTVNYFGITLYNYSNSLIPCGTTKEEQSSFYTKYITTNDSSISMGGTEHIESQNTDYC